MGRQDNRLGYIAVALGFVALALALAGSHGPAPMIMPAMVEERVMRAPQVAPAAPAVPAQPTAPAPPARDPAVARPETPIGPEPLMMPLPPGMLEAPMRHDHVFMHDRHGPFGGGSGLGQTLVSLLLIVCGIRLLGGRNAASAPPATGQTTRL